MRHNVLLGAFLGLLGAFFYSTQTTLIKIEASSLPPLPMVIFIQSVVSLLLILPLLFHKKDIKVFQSQQVGLQFLRTVFSLGISYALFYSLHFIPLVNAMLLANTVPLLVPFLGYFIFSHPINHRLWIPILIGFLGVMLVLRPDSGLFHPGSILAITAAVLMGASILAVRELSKTDSTETTSFYFFLFSTIISGIIAIYFWVPVPSHMWMIMLGIGVLYFLTQYFFTSALRYATAQTISTIAYSNIVYTGIFSIFLWNQYPPMATVFGMLFIVVGGMLCIYVSHRTQVQAMQPIKVV